MLRLLEFLYRRRIFGLFLVLQIVSLWLVFSYNHRYNTYYFNSSNQVVGEVIGTMNNVKSYFGLQQINDQLANENLLLRTLLSRRNLQKNDSNKAPDSAFYKLRLAKVVNASFRKTRNFLTLRINPEDSIKPGMGVVSSNGVVGRIKSVSKNFATVASILNPNLMISGRVKSNGGLCTIQWDGIDPLEAQLLFVPRHLKLNVGDSIITSGFNTVFPTEFPIGIVVSSELRPESPFYDARVQLFTDFTTIETVYIVEVSNTDEMIKLEEELPND